MSNHTNPVRNIGSGFTTFNYNGKAIAYLEGFVDSGQPTFGQTHEFIRPLGSNHPTDIVTNRTLDGGTITLTIRELWHQEVWEQLQGLAGSDNIVEIFNRLARMPNYVTCSKIITPPSGRKYGNIYHKCTIVNIQDGDTVTVGTLSAPKNITVAYTHKTSI